MRALWAGPGAEFHGEFVNFDPVTCSPRPVNGAIPIVVGGDSDAALKRAVRLADGFFPVEGDFTRLSELLARLARTAAEADRDPASIEINVMFGALFGAQMADPAAGIEQLASLGVDRIMVPAFFFAGPGGIDRLSEFGEMLIPLANG